MVMNIILFLFMDMILSNEIMLQPCYAYKVENETSIKTKEM